MKNRSIKKGDAVKYVHQPGNMMRPAATAGIVLIVNKKEVSRNKSKHLVEIGIAHTADVLWDSGIVEEDVPIESLILISRAK